MTVRRNSPGDRGPRPWDDAVPYDHADRVRLRRRVLLTVTLCYVMVASALLPARALLVWNMSASAPLGLYWVGRRTGLGTGDMVVAQAPAWAADLAAERHYLPSGVPLVKRVAAGPGDTVCARDEQVWIDRRPVARRRRVDAAGRLLPWWQGCVQLAPNRYFLLMSEAPASFDGRYFGVSRRDQIIGKARLLWRR